MATKIAVISDTHGLLRPEVLDRIAGCDVIIHGGDINKPEIIDRLKEIAPVYVVRGNNDKEWAENIPESPEEERDKGNQYTKPRQYPRAAGRGRRQTLRRLGNGSHRGQG